MHGHEISESIDAMATLSNPLDTDDRLAGNFAPFSAKDCHENGGGASSPSSTSVATTTSPAPQLSNAGQALTPLSAMSEHFAEFDNNNPTKQQPQLSQTPCSSAYGALSSPDTDQSDAARAHLTLSRPPSFQDTGSQMAAREGEDERDGLPTLSTSITRRMPSQPSGRVGETMRTELKRDTAYSPTPLLLDRSQKNVVLLPSIDTTGAPYMDGSCHPGHTGRNSRGAPSLDAGSSGDDEAGLHGKESAGEMVGEQEDGSVSAHDRLENGPRGRGTTPRNITTNDTLNDNNNNGDSMPENPGKDNFFRGCGPLNHSPSRPLEAGLGGTSATAVGPVSNTSEDKYFLSRGGDTAVPAAKQAIPTQTSLVSSSSPGFSSFETPDHIGSLPSTVPPSASPPTNTALLPVLHVAFTTCETTTTPSTNNTTTTTTPAPAPGSSDQPVRRRAQAQAQAQVQTRSPASPESSQHSSVQGAVSRRARAAPPSSGAKGRKLLTCLSLDTRKPHSGGVPTFSASPYSSPSSPPSTSSSVAAQLQEQWSNYDQHRDAPGLQSRRSPPPTFLVRTTSENTALAIQHPVPDIPPRSGALLGNIAHLEATAERLSMTSSIDDAIRDLHTELKRSDSRRSAKLAARVRAASSASHTSAPGCSPSTLHDTFSAPSSTTLPQRPTLARHYSATAASTMSPTAPHLVSSASDVGYVPHPSTASASYTVEPTSGFLSRSGPGKGSVRSVHSTRTKMFLSEIAETEPITLTQAVLDEADRATLTDGDDDTIRPQQYQDADAAYPDRDDGGIGHHLPTGDPPAYYPSQFPMDGQMDGQGAPHDRPATAGSTASEAGPNVFGDFDGVHCDPDGLDMDLPPLAPPIAALDHEPTALDRQNLRAPPLAPPEGLPTSPPIGAPPPPLTRPPVRPQSYLDPSTGQQMLYYPARVPMMLNLPSKLSSKPRTSVVNQRRSRMLNAMPDTSRQSAPWLGDGPREPERKRFTLAPLPFEGDETQPTTEAGVSAVDQPGASQGPEAAAMETTAADSVEPIEGSDEVPELKPTAGATRNSKMLGAADARKSRLSALPPQLRASVYFDMPSTSPGLEVKNGSAMDTLDSLLDASANAPVSAFTDHLIAGKLGAEIYGAEKKKRQSRAAIAQQRPTSADADAAGKKRNTLFNRGHRTKASTDNLREERSDSPANASAAGKSPRTDGASGELEVPEGTDKRGSSSTLHGSGGSGDVEHLDGDASDRQSEGDDIGDEEDEDDEDVYEGPPTTLLAELQLRKQQQKMRTRPINRAFPNGMHSTLLEMDAVAEAQRVNRKGKRVNLAWEDPSGADLDGESDDEDVPLGVLYAAKAGNADLAGDPTRPLGLMERRAIEDNEPLSHRKARLLGQDPREVAFAKRQTMLAQARMSQMLSNADLDGEAEEEVEGETLGERMRRLKAKDDDPETALPRARPVSRTFSAELLSQFGDAEGETDQAAQAGAAAKGDAGEETLGQRRRRLQAERAAAGETAGSGPTPRLSRPVSMADLLSNHPVRDTSLQLMEQQRQRDEARAARDQEEKLRALRQQMPASLTKPNLNQPGAFRGGMFNDGSGGLGIRNVPSPHYHDAAGMTGGVAGGMMPANAWNRSSVAFTSNGTPMPMAIPMPMAMPLSMPVQASYPQYGGVPNAPLQPMAHGIGAGANVYRASMMPGTQPYLQPMPGQADMVERWRQSII